MKRSLRRVESSAMSCTAKMWSVTCCFLVLNGCQALNDDRLLWLWLALPLIGIVLLGTLWVNYKRRDQIARWNLREEPEGPSSRSIQFRVITLVTVIAVGFVVYNLFLFKDLWTIALKNSGLWLLGSVIGTTLALFLGLRLAEPR